MSSSTTPLPKIELGFENLGLNSQLQRAVQEAGYVEPTPIQAKTIPIVLSGRDLIGCAQTGTGKTAAFALPILQKFSLSSDKQPLNKNPNYNSNKIPIRVLVISPTRELSIQIGTFFNEYGHYISQIKSAVIFGGVNQKPQVETLKNGVDILIATPGRLLDLIGQGFIKLDYVEVLVLDEADRMLDMGFIHDMRKILKLVPKKRQTLLFSATMPKEIITLANDFLNDPMRISVSPEKPTVEAINQSVCFVPNALKQVKLNVLLKDPKMIRTLVFSRTKHGANKIVKNLVKAGISAEPIHGNKSQSARQKALQDFRDGSIRVLVATDVAARGIDVECISHVIQYDLPNVPETYVHRIGRTGRAGAGGSAIALCDDGEIPLLKDIEKLIRKKVPIIEDDLAQLNEIKNVIDTEEKRAQIEPRSRLQSRPQSRSQLQEHSRSSSSPQIQIIYRPRPQFKPQTRPQDQSQSRSETRSRPQFKPQTHSQDQSQSRSETRSRPQFKPQPHSQDQSQSRSETRSRPQFKPQTHSQDQSQSRSETRSRPQYKPQFRSK